MNAYFYIKKRQVQWAYRHGINLIGSAGERGEQAYTPYLDLNLLQPLSKQATAEYESGKGGELAPNANGIRKMQAVHSSSALTVNLFQYWRDHGNIKPIAEACNLPSSRIIDLTYECQQPISDWVDRDKFPTDPNIDVLLWYKPSHNINQIGIECKFSEAYNGRLHAGLKPAYLEEEELWKDIPNCQRLAKSISPHDQNFTYLHPAQLLKHILSLKQGNKKPNCFGLLYLWYDVPFGEGARHQKEIERFIEIAKADNIRFQAITFQEVILKLAGKHRTEHRAYVDYLTDRYL